MTFQDLPSRRATAAVMIAALLAVVCMTAPAGANTSRTRALFDFNRTEIAAHDGDDVYVIRYSRTQQQLFRTDWTLGPSVLIWAQPVAGAEINSVSANGGRVALSLWDQTRQPGPKGSPDRIDTAVALVDRDGANPKVIASASLLGESMDEEKDDDAPVSCGVHVEVAAVADDGTLFIQRTTGTRISRMCKGTENVNEYRIERSGVDDALSPHFVKRERIDIADDPFNGDIAFGGELDMTTSNGFAVISDGDDATFEQLDGTGSRTVFRSPIHRANGFAVSIVRSDGSILMNDWRIGNGEPQEKRRIFLLGSPHAKPKRIAPRFTDAKGVDCGGVVTVWREGDPYFPDDRVWIYSNAGDFKRIVKLPRYTVDVDCSGNRLVTLQVKSNRRAMLSTITLR